MGDAPNQRQLASAGRRILIVPVLTTLAAHRRTQQQQQQLSVRRGASRVESLRASYSYNLQSGKKIWTKTTSQVFMW